MSAAFVLLRSRTNAGSFIENKGTSRVRSAKTVVGTKRNATSRTFLSFMAYSYTADRSNDAHARIIIEVAETGFLLPALDSELGRGALGNSIRRRVCRGLVGGFFRPHGSFRVLREGNDLLNSAANLRFSRQEVIA